MKVYSNNNYYDALFEYYSYIIMMAISHFYHHDCFVCDMTSVDLFIGPHKAIIIIATVSCTCIPKNINFVIIMY